MNQFLQELVDDGERGCINGVQYSINVSMDLLKFIMVSSSSKIHPVSVCDQDVTPSQSERETSGRDGSKRAIISSPSGDFHPVVRYLRALDHRFIPVLLCGHRMLR